MNEIAAEVFIWLLKIVGAYLILMIVLTIILSRWKKKTKQDADEAEQNQKKRRGKQM